jgi:hypothetical protein
MGARFLSKRDRLGGAGDEVTVDAQVAALAQVGRHVAPEKV